MTKSRGIRAPRGTRQRWVDEQQGKHFCACGCGAAIALKPEHFNTGIPQYLHGHNAKLEPPTPRKALPPAAPCGCGCGALAMPGKHFLNGHNSRGRVLSLETRQVMSERISGPRNHFYGKRSFNWKGGRTTNVHGYIEVQAPDHPLAVRGGYIREHRLVAETALRETDPDSPFLLDGYLHPGADVHHINGVRDDNRAENLEVMWRGQHTKHHAADLSAARWPKGH